MCSSAELNRLEGRLEVMRSLVASASRTLVKIRGPEEASHTAESALSSFPIDMQIPGGRHDTTTALKSLEF